MSSFCGTGKGNPLQYSCLEHSMDRKAWQAAAHGIGKFEHNWVSKLACKQACMPAFWGPGSASPLSRPVPGPVVLPVMDSGKTEGLGEGAGTTGTPTSLLHTLLAITANLRPPNLEVSQLAAYFNVVIQSKVFTGSGDWVMDMWKVEALLCPQEWAGLLIMMCLKSVK